jgi:hypothetical protein
MCRNTNLEGLILLTADRELAAYGPPCKLV